MEFRIEVRDGSTKARAGMFSTDHGSVSTPVFMPVGTAGSVKAVTQQQLADDVRAQIILGNTYHLYLRPSLDIFEQAGGLHAFNGWKRPIQEKSVKKVSFSSRI
jgi:queuine tRNA-ribosyltransferase